MTVNEVRRTAQNVFTNRDGLPEGWTLAHLGDGLVVDVQPGFACGENNRDGRGIAHLRPMNVHEEGSINLSIVKYVPVSKADQDKRLLRRGDVIFNNTNSPELVGKTAFYELPEEKAFSNHMTRLRCQTEILDSKFCAMALHQKWREGYFRTVCSHHVSQSSVSRAVLLNIPIIVPPLPEQRRIVAKVEELLARVNAAKERLTKVKEILKRFRQAVLAAACSGRLTADWRYAKEKLCNQRNTEIRISRFRDSNDYLVVVELPDIPEGWHWVTLQNVSEYQGGYAFKSNKFLSTGKNQALRIGNVRQGFIDLGIAPVFVDDQYAAEKEGFQLKENDLLITMTGTKYKRDYGFVGLVPFSNKILFPNQRVGRLRCLSGCLPWYLYYWLQTETYRYFFFKNETGNVNQGNVGAGALKLMPVPMPPIDEQKEIVRLMESLLQFADTIEKRVVRTAKMAEKLNQAILAKAFRGELVATEAELSRREGRSYEPVSALLAKIKAQREDIKAQQKHTQSRHWR